MMQGNASTAQVQAPDIAPSTIQAILAAGSKAGGGNDVLLIRTSDASVRDFFAHKVAFFLAGARDAATKAATSTFPAGGFVISEEHSHDPDRIADALIVVRAPKFQDAEEEIAAERAFYSVLVDAMPSSSAPLVDVLLRF